MSSVFVDAYSLVGLLVAVMISSVAANGIRKKIRIHIPQTVKHIHHHKKIYITRHPAIPQYAPAYLPTAEASVAIPTAAITGILPLGSLPFYEERRLGKMHGVNTANSPLLPLYRARGYYGPLLSWERPNRGVDFLPPPAFSVAGSPSALAGISGPSGSGSQLRPRMKTRAKVAKINDIPRKKTAARTKKPKRVTIHNINSADDPVPYGNSVSNFHEQFYSDVETGKTIKKIRKPKRVEKFIDGNTEHIHTYSEEHVHKVVFDKPSKVRDFTPLAALVGPTPIIPVVSAAPIFALGQTLPHPVVPSIRHPFHSMTSGQGIMGSMGTPAHLEYMGYNPNEVTHDHSYHDHGVSVDQGEFIKDFNSPPKTFYNQPHTETTPVPKFRRPKAPSNKWIPEDKVAKPPKEHNRFPYFDNITNPTQISNKQYKPNQFRGGFLKNDDYSPDISNEDYKPYLPRPKVRPRPRSLDNPYSYQVTRKPPFANRPPKYDHDFDFSTPSPITHESHLRPTKTREPFSSYQSPMPNFASNSDQYTSSKDIYSPRENFAFDSYAAPSIAYNENQPIIGPNPHWPVGATGRKKSISTQNISFRGQDHKMVVDHMADSSNIAPVVVMHDEFTTTETIGNAVDITVPQNPRREYYSQMAMKAFSETSSPNTESHSPNQSYQVIQDITTETSPITTQRAATITSITTSAAPMPIYKQYTSTSPTSVAQSASFVGTHTMKIAKKMKKSQMRRIQLNSGSEEQKEYNSFSPSSLRKRKSVKPIEEKKDFPSNKSKNVQNRNKKISSRKTGTDSKTMYKQPTSTSERGEHKYGDRL